LLLGCGTAEHERARKWVRHSCTRERLRTTNVRLIAATLVRTFKGLANFDSEMQRFESWRLSQRVRLQLVKSKPPTWFRPSHDVGTERARARCARRYSTTRLAEAAGEVGARTTSIAIPNLIPKCGGSNPAAPTGQSVSNCHI
jgi:hypothetical protein